MLRVVRRGDRHDARNLTVSCRFEGDFAEAFVDGQSPGLLPGEALKSLVHATAREHAVAEIERFGLALCDRLLAGYPRVTRARVEIAEQPWNRLEVGGKAQGQAFLAGTPERRTTAVTSNGKQVAVVAGLEQPHPDAHVRSRAREPNATRQSGRRETPAASRTGCRVSSSRRSPPAGRIRARK